MTEYRITAGQIWRQPTDLEVARLARDLEIATRLGGDNAVFAKLAAISVERWKPGAARSVAQIFASFSVDYRSLESCTLH